MEKLLKKMEEGDEMYEAFPRNRRGDLQIAIKENRSFPLNLDDERIERLFWIGTGDGPSALAHSSLKDIIGAMVSEAGIYEEEIESIADKIYTIYIDEMLKLTGGYKQRGRNALAIERAFKLMNKNLDEDNTNSGKKKKREPPKFKRVPDDVIAHLIGFASGEKGLSSQQITKLRQKNTRRGNGVGGSRKVSSKRRRGGKTRRA